MQKVIVFDLGGTLMEFKGTPLNWSDYYYDGFTRVNNIFRLDLSENDLQKSVEILKSYNPRINGRENEISPEIIFSYAIADWNVKPNIENVIVEFFNGLNLSAKIFDYTVDIFNRYRNLGYKIACLTDLPNGMPDSMLKSAISEIMDLLDLYVSSQSCGVRKPNKKGLLIIAEAFGVDISELLFVGDEEKDRMTAQNAGCEFVFIDDFLKKIDL